MFDWLCIAFNCNQPYHIHFQSQPISPYLLSIVTNIAMFASNPLPSLGPSRHICFWSSSFTRMNKTDQGQLSLNFVLFLFIQVWLRSMKANYNNKALFATNCINIWFCPPPIFSLFKFNCDHSETAYIQSIFIGYCSISPQLSYWPWKEKWEKPQK